MRERKNKGSERNRMSVVDRNKFRRLLGERQRQMGML